MISVEYREFNSFRPFRNTKATEKCYLWGNFLRTHARVTLNYMVSIQNKSEKGLSEQLFRLLPYILAALLLVVLIVFEKHYLRKVEDLSLFLFDWPFIKESFLIPGGFLGLCGSFLTQFLHLPVLGAILWVLLLVISYQFTIRAFSIPVKFSVLALIPAVLLIIGNMSLGYGLFIMREQDHFFSPVLGYLVALVPILTIKRFDSFWSKAIMLTIWTAAGFALTGAYALTGTIAASMLIMTDKSQRRSFRIRLLAASIILVILIPLIMYGLYTSYRMADSWTLGLPAISQDSWTRAIRTPFQLALIYLPLMSIAASFINPDPQSGQSKTAPGKDYTKQVITQLALYLFAIVSVYTFWFKDNNFHVELAMSEAVDEYDWQKVVDTYAQVVKKHAKSDEKAYAARTKALQGVRDAESRQEIVDKYSERFFEPTRTMVIYRDLALLKMNRALDEAFTMKDGSRLQKSRTQVPMAFQSGKQLYLQYGLVNMSYRWCLEDVIEHGWSYSTIKYMVLHSVVMHETEFARKYIGKLRKTVFYRKWAVEQEPISADSTLMAISEPYNEILPYMCFENRMSNDQVKSETFIMQHFSEPEPLNPTPEYDRAALLWAMRMQDISAFWLHLLQYLQTNDIRQLPRGVQEAAILYGDLEKDGLELPYSKAVTDSYNAFKRYVDTHPVVSLKESRYQYSKQFGNTFFYYYYFMRNLQTY